MKISLLNLLQLVSIVAFVTFVYSNANALTAEQIKQIEGIAQDIALQHNKNAANMTDEMTVSTRAVSRNVIFENILRVKKGLKRTELKEYQKAVSEEMVPRVCRQNANNPAFDRGLFYTFIYINTYGEKLAEIIIDKETCDRRN
jgi:hypothetical protein